MEMLEAKAREVKKLCVLCLKYFRNEAKKTKLLIRIDIELDSIELQIEIIKAALKSKSSPLLTGYLTVLI